MDDPDSAGEDFWDSLGKKIPLRRAGLPENVGRAVSITHTIYKNNTAKLTKNLEGVGVKDILRTGIAFRGKEVVLKRMSGG